jgi:hypothetical protein
MPETLAALEAADEERRAWDRRQATSAARLLTCCLGIAAEPAFDVTSPTGRDTAVLKEMPLGEGLYKDAFDFAGLAESRDVQLLVVDENGRIKAESKQCYPLGEALELLQRLPLPLSPQADRWLKNCLGEAGPATGRPVLAGAVTVTRSTERATLC